MKSEIFLIFFDSRRQGKVLNVIEKKQKSKIKNQIFYSIFFFLLLNISAHNSNLKYYKIEEISHYE